MIAVTDESSLQYHLTDRLLTIAKARTFDEAHMSLPNTQQLFLSPKDINP